ncbi:MAG: sigma-54-dependent transcriptional regulator [Limimaricola sp.]
MGEILVIEDEVVLARSIVHFLERRGFAADYAVDAPSAKAHCERSPPRLVILDYKLKKDDGVVLLDWLRHSVPDAAVVMMTGHGGVGLAVRAMKAGARDFLVKPVPLSTIATIAGELMLDEFGRGAHAFGIDRIIGRSSAARTLRSSIRPLAGEDGERRCPGVWIMGPPGSGKFLAARALHEAATRSREGMFVWDCRLAGGTDIAELASAVEEGAASTLVLRHVSSLGPDAQAGLLRALHASDSAPALIATCTSHPFGTVWQDGFMPDLLYRLTVGVLGVPALSERTSDILSIAEFTLRRLAKAAGRPRQKFTSLARAKLIEHHWEGNVAELINCLERAVRQAQGNMIDAPQIQFLGTENDEGGGLILKDLEIDAIQKALGCSKGNVSQAARLLGISRDTLRYRMQKFGL